MTQDPVCKMEVDEKTVAATSTYQGQPYFFCSKGCKEELIKTRRSTLPRKAVGLSLTLCTKEK